AVLTTLSLFIMPHSPTLWIAAGMLWIMDASINIAMEPFRAFVGDNLPKNQRTQGYAMQSFFIGIGAVVASALPYILTNVFDVENTAPAGEIADSVRYAFYFGGAVLMLAVGWTIISTKEYSPEQLAEFHQQDTTDAQDTNVNTRTAKQ
ncbi:MFS transporter, partial [Shewanella sp. T24-MNA-CIBAN-0130]